MTLRAAVFASGGGSNLQALIDHFHKDRGRREDGDAHSGSMVRIVLVVGDRSTAGALERAELAGIQARVIPVAGRAEQGVATETVALLRTAKVDLVVLAGYLRRIPPDVVRAFRGRLLNIHPALLPAFGGKGMYGSHVHRAVIEAGCRVSGATVHFVDEEYDRGPILAQWPVPVLPGDSAEQLAARVLRVEHILYPAAVEALASRIASEQGIVAAGDEIRQSSAGAAPPRGNGPSAFHLVKYGEPARGQIRRALGLE